MKKLITGMAVAAVAALAAVIALYLDLRHYAETPLLPAAEERVFSVGAGERFQSISRRLFASGFVGDAEKLRRYAWLKEYDKRIQAGEYRLSAAMSPRAILEVLVSGKVHLYRITIPEGYTLRQIAGLVADAGFTGADSFLAAATDPDLARRFGLEADGFEGYLFPDTYLFPRGAGPETLIRTMFDRFRTVFVDEYRQRAEAIGYTVHQIVTLASIIEKETGAPFERPLISSVFHNRLKKRMRLESDPTVIYGIEDFDGNITRKHLATDTPYNTYRIRGLPPGPIACPGKASIVAALYPADTPYLFFVSKKDGTHHFSETIQEHLRAVRKYQL